MTTHSIAQIGRRAIDELRVKRPDIRVKKISGSRIGSARLARVYFEDGTYLQIEMKALNTHTGHLVDDLVRQISTCKKVSE